MLMISDAITIMMQADATIDNLTVNYNGILCISLTISINDAKVDRWYWYSWNGGTVTVTGDLTSIMLLVDIGKFNYNWFFFTY